MTSRTPSPRFALALAAVGLSTSALELAACASLAPSATSSSSMGSLPGGTDTKTDADTDADAAV